MSESHPGPVQLHMSEDNAELVCSESCDISIANDLHQSLNTVLEQGQSVVLDMSAVERADTAVLQIICAFVQDARAAGIEISWKEPSLAFNNAVACLGLADVLDMANA